MRSLRIRKTQHFLRLCTLAWLVGGLAGCASRYSVFSDYHASIRETPQAGPTGQTVVLFLVDGMSAGILRDELEAGRLPNLRAHFGTRMTLGRSVFPTLTYPNISSILTASPIDAHPIIGNRVIYEGHDLVNYEQPWSSQKLNEALAGRTVFSALTEHHEPTVSFSYYFHEGTTSHIPTDLASGVAYSESDFGYVDGKVLDGFDNLLNRTPEDRWPRFVFVHLIGVDGLSHRFGPRSREALDYLRSLDARMGGTLSRLERAEARGHPVVSLLTADHGFMEIRRYLELEKPLRQALPEARIANQGRLASLSFPGHRLGETETRLLTGLARQDGILGTAWRQGDELRVEAGRVSLGLKFVRIAGCRRGDYGVSFTGRSTGAYCPEQLDALQDSVAAGLPPYFLSYLTEYFHSPYRPDAIVLAGQGATFETGERGTHGGPTAEEFLVPILARGATVRPRAGEPIARSYELLDFLREAPALRSTNVAANVPPGQAAGLVPVSYTAKDDGEAASVEPSFLQHEEGLSFQNGLELAVPTSLFKLNEKVRANGGELALSSRLSPGFEAQWRQLWSPLVSTWVGYGLRFASFDTGPAPLVPGAVDPNQWVAHHASLGGDYRFGDNTQLSLGFAIGQQFYATPLASEALTASPTAADFQISRSWVPELDFSTRTRVYSLGFADLVLGGGLGILFPGTAATGSQPDEQVGLGFRKRLALGLDRPVGGSDLLSLNLSADQYSQDTSYLERSFWTFQLSASYGMSFTK